MASEAYYTLRRYFDGIRDDLTRQGVLIAWGALLLAIYLTGWWKGDFQRIGLAVVVTFFITAPRARGLMVSVGLAALLWIYSENWVAPAELKGFRSEVKSEVKGIVDALRPR